MVLFPKQRNEPPFHADAPIRFHALQTLGGAAMEKS